MEPKESLCNYDANKAALPSTSSAQWGCGVRHMPGGMTARASNGQLM